MAHPKNLFLLQILILHLWTISVYGGQGWKHIPEIPAGRRAQYLLLKKDGGYKYGYDTGDGSSAFQSASGANEVTGNFAYIGTDGQKKGLQYTSGVSGFLPNLPPASSIPTGPLPSVNLAKSFGIANGLAPTTPDNGAPGDSSYSFSFDTGSYQRHETSDANLNIVGSYQYTGDDGQHNVQYSAGSATGFLANVDGTQYPGQPVPASPGAGQANVPVYPISSPGYSPSGTIPGDDGSTGDATYSFSYSVDGQSRDESSDAQGNVQGTYSYVDPTGTQQKVDYAAGDNTGFVVKKISSDSSKAFTKTGIQTPIIKPSAAYVPTAPSSSYDVSGPSDASYSFGYETSDQSRKESSDVNGNVQGSFSFIAKDGERKTVDYSAGSQTGFIATGAHLPTPPSPLAPSGSPSLTKSFPPSPQLPQPSYVPSSIPSGPAISSASPIAPDGSYSFSFQADDHSRTESGDANGNVKGSYSFITKDDGVRRLVDYQAGSATGFVANVSPGSAPSQAAAKTYFPESPTSNGYPSYQSPLPSQSSQNEGNGDASYAYSYQTDSSSKQETSDTKGNVAGSFTFLGGDGLSRTVQYTSKNDEGFIATGDHLPKVAPFQSVAGSVPQLPSINRNGFGIKGSSHSYNANALTQTKSSITGGSKISDFLLHTYLPPDSEKFGYIFDTKVN
ncbi:uncharacterized protein LOC142331199 [Lycorma delicatula]|uniref:uncharacterized protein LOC142331199 n=1 Tax=Lycorma delicatula TaxID=130591 RepID=UPI003F51118E